jgi:hypothetical protein
MALRHALFRTTRTRRRGEHGAGRRLLTASAAVTAALVLTGTAQASQADQAAQTTAARSLAAARTMAAQSAAPTAPLKTDTNAACNQPQATGFARCMAIVRTTASHSLAAAATAAQPPAGALGPAQIQSAYNLPAAGSGETVAIVDAYGDSDADSDLAMFRSYYGLPACTTASGCFRKVDQTGGTNYPADDPGWGLETSLDLDAVSSACPACNILLVEADDNSDANLAAAEDEAVTLGAKYVSNSYEGSEDPSELPLDSYFDHPGVAITVSSGDSGIGIGWPSSNPDVTAVGGTTLTADPSVARGWNETAWDLAGSGCSTMEPQPSYQIGVNTDCATRATADISADADPASGLGIYDTLGEGGWLQVGGTSLASPLIASMYALAGSPVAGTYPVAYPYHDPSQSQDLFDITSGSNGSCGTVLCDAGPGWDGPTGLGTPDGVLALSSGPQGAVTGEVTNATTGAPVPGATISASPGNYETRTDSSGDYTLDVAAGTYTLTAALYGYQTATQAGVQVGANQDVTQNLGLTALPYVTVSGTVTDGSGHGWPLYAQLTIPGYPNGHIYTNPFTGRYSVLLPESASYAFQITAAYPVVLQEPGAGYLDQDTNVTVGTSDLSQNFALAIDPSVCTALGYGWDGLSGWSGPRHSGWTVTGSRAGWQFGNPDRLPAASETGLDNDFASADSSAVRHRVATTLTSPRVNLTGQASPQLTFDTAYYAAPRQTASVDLSLDGGRSWTTIWHQAASDAIGQVQIPLPQAAGKTDVRVRFRYTGSGGWWWAVDQVLLGTRECVPLPGGMLAGLVSDQATGLPVNAAQVTAAGDPQAAGLSTGTGDPGLTGAFYWLFTPFAGSQKVTATAPGYSPAKATVNIPAGQLTRHDWALAATSGG